MHVDLPRPRSRQTLLEHPDYYAYREELLDFLHAYEGGAHPDPQLLHMIEAKRAARIRNRFKPEPEYAVAGGSRA